MRHVRQLLVGRSAGAPPPLLACWRGRRTCRGLAAPADQRDQLRAQLAMEPAQWALLAKRYPRLACERQGPELGAGAVGVVDMLLRELEMDSARARRLVLGAPAILGFSAAKLQRRLAFWRARLTLSRADMRRVLAAYPQALQLRTRTNVEPTLAHLSARLGLGDAELRALVLRWPPLVGMEPAVGLESKLAFLQARLQLDEAQLRRLVCSRPRLVGCTIGGSLEPKLGLLQAALGASASELRKLVLQAPQLLENSLHKLLEAPRVLSEALGLSREQLCALAVRHPPALLFGAQTKLLPTVAFLRERLGLSDAQLQRLLCAKPQLFSYARANLEAKLAFFEHEVGASREEVRAAVLASPPILGFSLAGRMRPRLERLRADIAGEQRAQQPNGRAGAASARPRAESGCLMHRFRIAVMRTEAAGTPAGCEEEEERAQLSTRDERDDAAEAELRS